LNAKIGALALAQHLLQAGLSPAPALLEMLQEHFSHQSERRGCGFTQATRWLSDLINRERSEKDLRELGGSDCALWQQALKNFDPPTEGQAVMRALLLSVLGVKDFVHQHNDQTIDGHEAELPLANDVIALQPIAAEKLKIGTCPLAEQFFLEVACDRIRRGGRINVICSDAGAPLLLEKRGLGDEHSAISIASVQINAVVLPPGTLIGLAYDDASINACKPCKNGRGQIVPVQCVELFRYLRLTTLVVSPLHRHLTFSTHFDQQVQNALFLPESARIDQLMDFAMRQL
jgi:hypothetical protein